ncbi:hypothetical protein Goari_008958 [Gossypium aridum]|uniref:LOB domain-containing protein n=1 Tax=Gossypium aridum TaxID=34290 RepID=A0A7J8XVK3_GOSAI|nr:hypothetical protein [Gossypium aridum]
MSNGEETAPNTRHACAACKHQRRKCESNCVFAPFFPASRAETFREVHKIFGVKNMTGILTPCTPDERKKAVESLEWEALAWTQDPVRGPLGLFRRLEEELQHLNDLLDQLVEPYQRNQINSAGLNGFNHNSVTGRVIVPNSNINATNIGYGSNPYLGIDVPPIDNYDGVPPISSDGLNENQLVVNNYFPGYYGIPDRLAVFRESGGVDNVAQTSTPSPTLPPKQETMGQRNQIWGPSGRPLTNNHFPLRNHRRGRQQRYQYGFLQRPASQSQGRGLH